MDGVPPPSDARIDRAAGVAGGLSAGLVAFAVYHLGLAVLMAAAPHAFYRAVGPFEALNRHYIRDVATYTAALGVGFAVAARVRSWRVPVLAIATVQFALHTVNHLLDAGKAHPRWTGWFDFGSLLIATLLLAWMLRAALAARTRAHQILPSPLSTIPGRSTS